VAEELRAAGPDLLTADLDGIETRLHAMSRRVCGATMERVLAVRAGAPGERSPCPACGGLLRLVDQVRGAGPAGADRQRDAGPADLCLPVSGLQMGPLRRNRGRAVRGVFFMQANNIGY